MFHHHTIQKQTTERKHYIDKQSGVQKDFSAKQQLIEKIKKKKYYQNSHLRKQQFDCINIRGVPDNSRIRSKDPKEENVNTNERANENQTVRRNNIILTRPSKDQICKKESNSQNSDIQQYDDPAWQITKIMNVKSQVTSRKIL